MVDWFQITSRQRLVARRLIAKLKSRDNVTRGLSPALHCPAGNPGAITYSNLSFAKDEEELCHPARSTQHTSQYFPNFRPFSLNTPTTLNPNRRCSASVAAFGNTYTPTKR